MGYPVDESEFAREVRHELERAERGHKPINSLHEGYAVILEEVNELWDEVKKKTAERHMGEIYRELVQIAAMCQRLAKDLNLPVLMHKSSYQDDATYQREREETRRCR